ncbi:MAG: hypothetical protein AAB539_00450 [Patescibacteria group bacterium]
MAATLKANEMPQSAPENTSQQTHRCIETKSVDFNGGQDTITLSLYSNGDIKARHSCWESHHGIGIDIPEMAIRRLRSGFRHYDKPLHRNIRLACTACFWSIDVALYAPLLQTTGQAGIQDYDFTELKAALYALSDR